MSIQSLPIPIFSQAAISFVSHLVHASGDDIQIDLVQQMIMHHGITEECNLDKL